ncbi:MAG: hypothetical protein A3G93_16115 [Nitrospinae bacterium RIFCSPLOWO2_12_FULL_45_22]|nr:MAG: hypothetical protein A3G93_16115 [Nitrospinae bacterium RIFCSPLOWO2_12_FULL_45_22]
MQSLALLKPLPLWQGKALLLLCVLRDSVAKCLKSFREKLLSLNFAQTKFLIIHKFILFSP